MDDHHQKVSRRDFLRLGVLAAGSLALARLPAETPDPVVRVPQVAAPLPANPLLKRLGFSDTDRVLIVQASDTDLCESTLAAFVDLVDAGLVTCGTAMVPCAWFPQAAHFARTHPNADIGVSLTLTSEWDTIRWRALTTVDPDSGLLDKRGYLPKSGGTTAQASSDVVAKELEAQVARALKMGINLTHAGSHQLVGFNPAFTQNYLHVARQNALPAIFLRADEAAWKAFTGVNPEWIPSAVKTAQLMEKQDLPLLDRLLVLAPGSLEQGVQLAKAVIGGLPAGVHLVEIHAGKDTPDLRAMTPDWQGYVANYRAWTSADLAGFVKQSGVQLIGWKPIRQLLSTG